MKSSRYLRNSYGAEFGQSGGAQINIVTRSGTNKFTGSGFYFGRNDALNATNYFIKQANQPKDQLSRNDYGWTFGGPIVKNRLQFFASQEWNKETRGSVRAAFVPTAAERAGNFNGPSIPGCTNPDPDRSADRRALSQQSDSGGTTRRGRRGLPESISAAEHHAACGELQQLGDLAQYADRLAPGERPRRLLVVERLAPHGPLHAGQLDQQRAEPAVAICGETIRSPRWTRTGTSPASRSSSR